MRIVSLGRIIAAVTIFSACSHGSVAALPALAAVSTESAPPARAVRVPGEYLVTLGAAENESVIAERYGRFAIKSVSQQGNGTYLLTVTNDPGPQEMEALIRTDSRIRALQPNFIYRAEKSSNSVK